MVIIIRENKKLNIFQQNSCNILGFKRKGNPLYGWDSCDNYNKK